MSTNVVPMFAGQKPVKRPTGHPDDREGMILAIINWAESRGIDLESAEFQIRMTDFIGQMQIMARDAQVAQCA